MPQPNYFGGDSVASKVVKRLDATNFRELIDRYLNAAIALNYTKAQFFALESGYANSPRDLAKRVPYFTPCEFATNPSDRLTANAKAVWLVCLDIDPEKDREGKVLSYPAAPYAKNPDLLFKQLEGLNFALYQTAQYRPEEPRLRIIVEANGFDPSLYRQAVSYVAARIGLSKVTSESGVVVQAMFRPTVFSDTVPEVEHPLLAFRYDAAALTPEDFAGADPLDTQPRGKTGGISGEDTSGDALAFLRPPVEGVTLKEAGEALAHIDPDLDYRDWLQIAAALKHQFPRGEENQGAFELFDSWSSKGQKYVGEDDTSAKWRSLRPTPVGRVPITIRTIFHAATNAGWDNSAAKQRCFESTRARIRGALTRTALTDDALNWLITTPLLTPVDEEALLAEILRLAKENFDYTPGIVALRKELKRRRANIEAARKKEREGDTPAPPWAMGLCYVEKTKQIYRFSNRVSLDRDSFDSSYARYLLPSPEALEQSGQADSPKAAATPVVRPQDFVLNLLRIPTAYDDFYDPREPDSQLITIDKRLHVNTYRKSFPEPDPELSKEAGGLFLGHIQKLIAEPEFQRLFIDFLAYLVQFPGRKVRWAVLIQGTKGCGKSFIERAMRAVLGSEHVKQVDPASVFSDYNDWAYGAQLTVLNEIRVHGHSRYDIMNRLKEPIADDRVSIKQKYRDHREVLNLTNYLMFTNHHDALAIEPDERRYFVVKSPIQKKEQVIALKDSGHFDRIFEMLKTHAGGLRHFFETWEISDSFPVDGPAPETKYLAQMQRQTAPEQEVTLQEILADGTYPLIQHDLISFASLQTVLETEYALRVAPKQLSGTLQSLGFENVGRYRINGERQSLWVHNESGLDGLDLSKIAARRVEKAAANGSDGIFEKISG